MPKRLLQAGDVIKLEQGHTVYADIPEHFAFNNRKGVFDKFAHTQARIGGELEFLAGLYIVTHTSMNGGGTGMGPGDVYPDGHHVYCERTSDRRKVDFYQTGAFTAMIPEIEPVGKAELTWTATVFFNENKLDK
jgi:hypothetical protein